MSNERYMEHKAIQILNCIKESDKIASSEQDLNDLFEYLWQYLTVHLLKNGEHVDDISFTVYDIAHKTFNENKTTYN